MIGRWQGVSEARDLSRLKSSETKDERKTLMDSCRKVVGSLDFKKKLTAVSPREPFAVL